MKNLKEKVAKGAVWTLAEKFSVQFVNFFVAMVLARLLTPTDYGTVALTSIFFSIAGVLVDCGFGNALVQKKDADDLDFNSVFYLNFGLSLLVYWLLFFFAPMISEFYETPALTAIVRVAALSLVFNAISAIQNAELVKKMLFNLSFRVSVITCVVGAICGVTLAWMGWGVWALVWSSLAKDFSGLVARWAIIAWRPKLMFSWSRLGPLFSYGWKMAVSAVIDRTVNNLRGLVIGKIYTKADLAYLSKGSSLPNLAMDAANDTLGRVSFPALVQLQDEPAKLREAMRKMMRCGTFLGFPLMVGIAACAKSELRLFFGEQWVPAAPYMMLCCFSFALWPFHTINLRGIQAMGRSDIFLKLEIIKKVVSLLFLIAFIKVGLLPFMIASTFFMGPFGVIVNSWPNRRLLNYSIKMQIADVLPTAVVCGFEALGVFGVDWALNLTRWGFAATGAMWSLVVVLVLQGIVGAVTFLGLAYVFRLGAMGEYLKMAGAIMPRSMAWLPKMLERRFE